MRNDIEEIASNYGLDKQLNQLNEECAELIVAISKYKRARYDPFETADLIKQHRTLQNVIEEMADVELMIDQVKYLLPNSQDLVMEVKMQKLLRQKERIKNERKQNKASSING